MKKLVSALVALAMANTVVSAVPTYAVGSNDILESTKDNNKILKSNKEHVAKTSREIDFTKDWKFNLGDVNGAQTPKFDDSTWRGLDLPHDWSIELDFNPNSPATHEGGYLDGGTAWYRKTFTVDDSMKNKEISIDFDGVYMESEVYVNGSKVGEYQNGYTPFSFDIAEHLNFDGEENTIAVKVVNRQPSSRWYSGSGIYRNVYLTVTEDVHVDRYGTFVTTPTLEQDLANGNTANVNIETSLINENNVNQDVVLKSKVISPTGDIVAEHETNQILSPGVNDIVHDVQVENPVLWGVYEGNLYNVVTEVLVDGELIDSYDTRFGFRYFNFDAETGFSLNGEWMKLNGVCMHHDLGALGSAVNEDAVERQIDTLIDMGVNAIRVTHNPASNEFLELCEEKGMLVIDEAFDTWNQSKKQYDYGRFFNQYAKRDIQAMVDRGKNSPSIIMWSIGNEIYDTNNASGVQIAKDLVKWVKEIDTTRPTTIGEDKYRGSKVDGVPNWHQYRDQVFDAVDVVGYNYSENVYDVHHEAKPDWIKYGSEISSAVRSRGIYLDPSNPNISDWENLQTSSYDNSVVGWGRTAEDSTKRDRERQFIAGQFIWTGFDYIGEPTPFYNSYPAKSSYFGAVDTAGFEKDIFYFYQSQWTDEPMVHLLPHWNWQEGENIKVWAYSNADTVELFLNGESIGERSFETKTTSYGEEYLETTDGKLHLEWDVPFTEGTIKAIAKKDGVVVAEDEITTAKAPAKVKMTPEEYVIEADGTSLAFIEVDIVDENNTFVPTADNLVEFEVKGGTIVGVDNGNASSIERYKDDKRKAFSGKALLMVQADENVGEIEIKATSKGLETDTTTVVKVESTEGIENEIVGFEPIMHSAIVGEDLGLPTEVNAIYGNSTISAVPVIWDVNPGDFTEQGIYEIEGTVAETNIKAKGTLVIKNLLGLKSVSTVTKVSVQPELPAEVSMVYSDGTEKVVPVVWDAISEEDLSQVGTISIQGTVEGTDMKATASIRIVESGEVANVATDAQAFASRTGSGDQVSHLNDEVISYNNSPHNRWTNWPAQEGDNVGLEWEEEITFDSLNLYTFADSGCAAPSSLTIEYYDGTDWVAVTNMVMSPETPVDNQKHEITFDPITTRKIRVNMENTPGKSLALTEIEVFAEVIRAHDNASLTDLNINGTLIEGFNSETLAYEMVLSYGTKVPTITGTAADNGVVSIVPPMSLPGTAIINVVAENGKDTKEYRVDFKMENPYLSNVAIDLDKLDLVEDEILDLSITAKLIDESIVDINNTNVELVSSDSNIVDFRDGKVVALTEGTVDIYANVTYDGVTVKSNTLTVTVTDSGVDKHITAIKPTNIIVSVGTAPVLPETVEVEFNVGLSRKLPVVWNEVNPENYSEIGRFTVDGTVEGTDIKAIANIEVKGLMAVESVSTVTLVGEEPSLPSEITLHYSDNTEEIRNVTWNSLTNEQLNTVGIYELEGTVEGLDQKAKITVRVSADGVEGLNISRFQNGYDYPRTEASFSNEPPASPTSNDRLEHVNNDIISFDDTPHDRWTNWKNTPDSEGWVSVEFGRANPQEYYVDEMTVHYFEDHGVKMPASAKVQYMKDGEWVDVINQREAQGEFEKTKVYSFDKIKTSKMRIYMTPQEGKSLGITEIQIFTNDVIKNTNSLLSAIELDGEPVAGFNSEVFAYEAQLKAIIGENGQTEYVVPEIVARGDGNPGITIIQPVESLDNTAKIIVKAEDGISESVYTIKFAKELEITVSKVRRLRAENVTNNSIELAWDAPEHVEGLVGYEIYKDGKLYETVDLGETSIVIDGLKKNSIYNFKVLSKYSNGQKSRPVSKSIRTIK